VLGVLLALNGFATTMWSVVTVSMRQRMVPSDLLGRVNSAYRMLGWGLMPLGALAGGLVARELGVRAATIGRPCRRGRRGHRPGTGSAAAGTVCGRPNVANRPGSLNEVTRVTRDPSMVSTHIECARYPPSWPRM